MIGFSQVDDVQTAARMFGPGDSSKCRSNADKSADNRQHCEHCQRHPHRRRRLVRHVRAVIVSAVSMCRNVMRDVFVYWSNMLAGFVSWTIAG